MHRVGTRSAEPFVATNIAAIPATLLESELFGRERGAYTGAMNRQVGRFEVADGGTLFLDEVGEMPLETQVKLLRVLECGQFERLGSSRTVHVNVRVIAATNRKFPELLRAGTFRQDLYYRLNVFPLTMPPLRERLADIPALVWAFIKEFAYKMGKPIERVRAEDLAALQRYHWPGNVRELRNVIERSMILTSGTELRIELPEPDATCELAQRSRLLRDVEHAHIQQVLKSTRGRIRGKEGAAEILGLKPTTLYSLMQRLGIDRARATT
jgi:transcriptional regulator with GAF, ATPase, and Fis domain